MLSALVLLASLTIATPAQASPELSIRGRHFVARDGRTVILRGVNISTAAKIPPFDPLPGGDDLRSLTPLRDLGLNAIRLVFLWEAYEPEVGIYNEAYLERIASLARTAWSLGFFTIVDMHQDSFSRFIGDGCGVGFPAWVTVSNASSKRAYKECGPMWAVTTAMNPAMHRAYSAFFRNERDARTRFLEMWKRIARRLRDVPGVVGYDLLNEPWGDEVTELGPLYNDAAAAIRAEDPSAIAFIEPGLLSVLGLAGPPNLDRPTGAFAYAPHFYDVLAAGALVYLPDNPWTDAIFERMPRQAREWNVPLLLGEFGAYANTANLERLMNHQYDLLDESLASGTQWNYTPTWTPRAKDGWNGEDYSIVDDQGRLRGNFIVHPYPRRVAGTPLKFRVTRAADRSVSAVELRWRNDPSVGEGVTELFLPIELLFKGRRPLLEIHGAGLGCEPSIDQRTVTCRSAVAGLASVRVALTPARAGL